MSDKSNWVVDTRPENIDTYTETSGDQAATYKLVDTHPIIGRVLDKLAFFRTHAAAVWYNKLTGKSVKDKLDELDEALNNVSGTVETVDPMTATVAGFAADALKTKEVIAPLQTKMASFEQAKSTIINSALGKALGMTASTALETISSKIANITNRGTWTGSITTYNGKVIIPAGYHNGSGYVQASITNRGAWTGTITTANGKITIPAGYHNGSGYVQASGLYVPPQKQSGTYTWYGMPKGKVMTKVVVFPTAFPGKPSVTISSPEVYDYQNDTKYLSATIVAITATSFSVNVTSSYTGGDILHNMRFTWVAQY